MPDLTKKQLESLIPQLRAARDKALRELTRAWKEQQAYALLAILDPKLQPSYREIRKRAQQTADKHTQLNEALTEAEDRLKLGEQYGWTYTYEPRQPDIPDAGAHDQAGDGRDAAEVGRAAEGSGSDSATGDREPQTDP